MGARGEMQRRAAAAQATLDRFVGRAFAWGRDDCVRLAAFHLRKMGHRPHVAKAGSYRSALSARRALARAGHQSLEAAVDSLGLVRIPMAAAIVGDVGLLPSDAGTDEALGALIVCLGNGRWLGFAADADHACAVFQPLTGGAAWRA